MGIYEERENLRDKIKLYWKGGRVWTVEDRKVSDKLDAIHAKIVSREMLDPLKKKQRIVFTVCGWSEKHGYFRSKIFRSESFHLCLQELQRVSKELDWKTPTLIVEEIYCRLTSPAMVDFEGDIYNLGFSDHQILRKKHMCGCKRARWSHLIRPDDLRFTY